MQESYDELRKRWERRGANKPEVIRRPRDMARRLRDIQSELSGLRLEQAYKRARMNLAQGDELTGIQEKLAKLEEYIEELENEYAALIKNQREYAEASQQSDAVDDLSGVWWTVKQIAEINCLSVRTAERYAGKLSAEHKRWRWLDSSAVESRYPWEKGGQFDETRYNPPGWRAYNRLRQAKNRDGQLRLPESYRGHANRVKGGVTEIGANQGVRQTAQNPHGTNREVMATHSGFLGEIDPGLAPLPGRGRRVLEYKATEVMALLNARRSPKRGAGGRFEKR